METAFDHLKKVVNAFRIEGFGEKTTQKQYVALDVALRLKEHGHTIREIAELMGYKHPGSISHLLNQAKKKNS